MALGHRGALDIVYNANQTGVLDAINVPAALLTELCEWGLLSEFAGREGGRFFIVTDQGKQLLGGQQSSRKRKSAA